MLDGKKVVITGGTGSLGQVLTRRLLEGEVGVPRQVVVFSRSEALQHTMRLAFQHRRVATDDIVYDEERHHRLVFRLGDVRDLRAVAAVLRDADVVFHAAAMKQVPACEYHPVEAVRTNVDGAANLVRAIQDLGLGVQTVVGISTDKACKPVNVMGMTKAIQERILIDANLHCDGTRFIVARYGNVIASRGSVVPLFREQIAHGGPLTLTTPEMTRFLLSLDEAVDLIFAALRFAHGGETYIPRVPAARIADVAGAMAEGREIELRYTGIRPGEKVHEVLVSEEETPRTSVRGEHLVVAPILPELRVETADEPFERREFSSADEVLQGTELHALLNRHGVTARRGATVTP
ncbi:MAG: polysaccharide biosynthesis protein [Solirubrobacterales bacterium]|nr:polysaccharide biosynthesis protein [Solirubrobacterales bacterium]MBV9916730.1 polysaccharide biosynthesis protein [Solirubrobacterales bacterium]